VSNPSPAPSSGRILELDGLRGLAALGVVFFHFTTRYTELFGAPNGMWFNFPRGDYGVCLFFMLSGYVIFMTLDRTASARDFIVARFARLYPTYWAAMLLTFVVVSAFGLPGQEVGLRDFFLNLTIMQSLLGAQHIDGAYWSLQTELLFYAALLFLWQCGWLTRAQRTLAIWLACVVLLQLAAWCLPEGPADKLGMLQTLLIVPYFHLFAIGMAIYCRQCEGKFDPGWLLLVIACWFWHAIIDSTSGAALIAAFTTVVFLAGIGKLTWLAFRPLVWLGAISYPLYLVHQNVGYVLLRWLNGAGWNPNTSVLAALAVVIAIAAALHYLVEQPALVAIKGRYSTWKETPRTPIRLPRRKRRPVVGG
jgi:peptidoglycan/LPS O-acetylase OafA/YrhL